MTLSTKTWRHLVETDTYLVDAMRAARASGRPDPSELRIAAMRVEVRREMDRRTREWEFEPRTVRSN